jgi:hypothetical protein
MDVAVHNLHPDIELISPVYFCSCEKYDEYLVKRTDVGVMMKIGFRFDLGQDRFGGILVYEVQRKGNTKSDHQPRADTTSAVVVGDTSKMMRILVAWKIEGLKEPRVYIVLVEYDSELVLNEDKLARSYDKINDQLLRYDFSKSTWLVCDSIALMATCEVVWEEGFELKIIISEGVEDKNIMNPMRIDSERQVSYLMVIYFY